jgi:NAD(P)H-hydrate repair Nnr-like enzyme with NAD(P)H-hydrate dehydratase domain
MKIPEDLRIPAIVFALQAALLAGCGLVFVLLAQGH